MCVETHTRTHTHTHTHTYIHTPIHSTQDIIAVIPGIGVRGLNMFRRVRYGLFSLVPLCALHVYFCWFCTKITYLLWCISEFSHDLEDCICQQKKSKKSLCRFCKNIEMHV